MKICFPARKADGKEYASLDEMMAHIGKEAHGFWLAGLSGRWHGGIHITDESAPGSVMNSETAETAVPLPFMVGGEVVAWRIGKDYVTSEYMNTVPQFSSTFVLVKSVCTPEAKKPDNSLEFYTLYMGLAPLSVFPRYKQYKVTQRGNGLSKRRHTGQEKTGDALPFRTGEKLKEGDRVVVLQEKLFNLNPDVRSLGILTEPGAESQIKVLRKNSSEPGELLHQLRELNSGVKVLKEKEAAPKAQRHLFGLARLLNDKDEMTGDAFWASVAEEYMTPEGEICAGLPAWMKEAVSHNVYDQVVIPPEKISVQAGEAVGFLGEDFSPAGGGNLKIRPFVHIEVISTDSRLEDFLNNKAEVRSGGKYIHIHPDSELYMRSSDSFTKNGGTVRKDIHKVLPQSKYQEFTDNEGKRWFDIGNGRGPWLSGADVDADISQYDLAKRGFCAFEEGTTEDMAISLNEEWVKQAMEHFAGAVIPARGIREKLVSNYYKTLVDRIDTDHNGRLSVDEILRAMTYPELDIQDIAARLVIKHDSEWYGDSQHQKWEKVLKNCDSLRVKYVNKWLDSMEWMSHVPPFDKGEPIWHMHPVMFLDALRNEGRITIVYKDYNYTLSEALDKQMALKGDSVPTFGNYGSVTRDQVRNFMDPILHKENSEIYQFLDISASSGITYDELSKFLENEGVLSGKANVFINAAKKYNVSEVYLVSHAILETNHGKSGFADGSKTYNGKSIYNMYGIGVFPGNT